MKALLNEVVAVAITRAGAICIALGVIVGAILL
jgi:hypothetical protein